MARSVYSRGLTTSDFSTLRRVLRFHCGRAGVSPDSPEANALSKQLVRLMLQGRRDEASLIDSLGDHAVAQGDETPG